MLKITRHASERMQQRGITEDDITYCLANYHTSYSDKAGNPIYKAQLPDGRQIKVVVASGSTDAPRIITVAES